MYIKERQFICKCKNIAKQHDATMKRRKSNGPAEQHAQIIAFSWISRELSWPTECTQLLAKMYIVNVMLCLSWPGCVELCRSLLADTTDRGWVGDLHASIHILLFIHQNLFHSIFYAFFFFAATSTSFFSSSHVLLFLHSEHNIKYILYDNVIC